MTNIAIVGSGSIGASWAIVFAAAGHRVRLWDPGEGVARAALTSIRPQLAELLSAGVIDTMPDEILSRMSVAETMAHAVETADYIQENGPEKLDIRRQLFVELDNLAHPNAIIASSTSGMAPSSFTDHLTRKDRCLVAHPANPPHLLPLVELCPSPWTSVETMQRAQALMVSAGRQVAALKHEAEGFLLNRLQGALLAEAFRIVAAGIADPDDIDTVMKHALGRRWSFMGPFETVDLNAPGGISDFCARYGSLYENLQRQMPPREWDAELVATVAEARRADLSISDIPDRQAWRDRRLMSLAAYLQTQPNPRDK
ncbi:MAG: 3-hydroxyacyl-CoA dehydrogenase [Rhizobiales bacterium]|nr:3-hydroxyacyl-CoA dehydrogenase [Hyphomicrobiales bacterium]